MGQGLVLAPAPAPAPAPATAPAQHQHQPSLCPTHSPPRQACLNSARSRPSGSTKSEGKAGGGCRKPGQVEGQGRVVLCEKLNAASEDKVERRCSTAQVCRYSRGAPRQSHAAHPAPPPAARRSWTRAPTAAGGQKGASWRAAGGCVPPRSGPAPAAGPASGGG